MRVHTNDFKNTIIEMGREINSKITYIDNGTAITLEEELYQVTYRISGNILKSVMKELEVKCSIDIPKDTVINYQLGVLVNGSFEYIDYGNYVVYKSEKEEDTNLYSLICYDKMLYSMVDYEDMQLTYPITIKNYIIAICTHLGLTFANASDIFANCDNEIPSELYADLSYTFRDVLDELAQVTASTICINDNDQLELRYIHNTGDTIDEEFFKSINVSFGEKYGPINSIVLSREGEDNVYLRDEESVAENGLCELKIYDNQILNGRDRSDYLQNILDELDGLEYFINDFSSLGILYYEVCDKYNASIGENTYPCILFNDEITITSGIEENIYTEMPEESETDYTKADKTDRKLRQTSLIVDKQNQKIESLITNTIQVYDEIEKAGLIITSTAKELPAWLVKIIGKKEYESGSAVVVPTSYTLVVMPEQYPFLTTEDDDVILTEDNEEIIYSTHKYTIECDELLSKDDVSDSIEIADDRNIMLVRRIGISEGNTYVLENEVSTKIGELTVDLYNAQNYIYLEDDNETVVYIKYILENDFTEGYVSNFEIISAINQSLEGIEIQGHKISLEGYTTINDGFSIDEEGNMTCNDATINGTMYDKDGNILVWNEGVYSNLQFISSCISDGELDGRLVSHIGYYQSMGTYWLARLVIEANIPSNFKVTSAYITITHQPIEYSGVVEDESTGQSVNLSGTIGYARGIQIFADGSAYGSNLYELEMGSEVVDSKEMAGTNTLALGNNGKTFSNTETEVVISKDLSEYLQSGGAMVFKIGTLTSANSIEGNGIKYMYERVGRATAKLNVYGYLKEVKDE